MKKIVSLICILALIASLCACGAKTDDTPAATTVPATNVPATEVPATEAPTEEPTAEPTEAVPTAEPTEQPTEDPNEVHADVIDFVFDENGLVDRSGNTYDIQALNDPYIVKNDKLGRYVFEGDGGDASSEAACYNIFGYDIWYETLEKAFTTEVYCMMDEASQEMYALSNLHAAGFSIGTDPKDLDYGYNFFTLFREGSGYEFLDYGEYEEGKWVHLAFTWDGTTLTGYKDGVKVDSITINDFYFPTVAGAKYLCIGADSSEDQLSEYFWDGQIASGKIYSRCLTADEIAADYAKLPKDN